MTRLPSRCGSLLLHALLICGATARGATKEEAKALVEKLGVTRGICLVLGAPDPSLPVELARVSELMLYVQCEKPAEAAAARKAADEAGLLGTRVYVAEGPRARLHLAERLADRIVVASPDVSWEALGEPARGELERVQLPGADGFAAEAGAASGRVVTAKGERLGPSRSQPDFDADTDVWSHPYHGPDNNPQSRDKLSRGPYLTKFLAEPFYGPMPEVTVANGQRIFKAFGHISFKEREWPLLNKLMCFNAYNGALVWQRDLTPGFMVHRNTMVTAYAFDRGPQWRDRLYLGDNTSCKVIDGATGDVVHQIVLGKDIAAGPSWKWMAVGQGKDAATERSVMFAMLGEEEPADETLRGTAKTPGWPWSGLGKMYDPKATYRWGFGRTFVAINLFKSDKLLWHHTEAEPIDGRAVAMNDKHIFYYSPGKFVAALDRATGEVAWKTSDEKTLAAIGKDNPAQNPRLGFASTCYLKCTADALYFAGPQRESLVCLSANDGKLLWHHPHGNYQLVIRKEGLFAMGRTDTCKLFEPLTGKVREDFKVYRGNCTRATGAADCIFARGGAFDINTGHTGTLRLDLAGEKPELTRISLMRPACQDGVVVANGQLYWGPWMCDCNNSLVGIISLAPAGTFDFEQKATEKDRLVVFKPDGTAAEAADARAAEPAKFEIGEADWPAYRRDNRRQSYSPVSIGAGGSRKAGLQLRWTYTPKSPGMPAAPITAGGLVLVSGADGAVRALDAATGTPRWTAYTSGPIKYPPAVWQGRVIAGSCDGCIYCFEAATGKSLWKFRAAPIERVIPVYGTLSSTWPVAGGVIVDDQVFGGGTIYAAAGIASYDGTHVYALDAATGRIRWQNNTSGRLVDKQGRVTGVSLQGHLLLHDDGKQGPRLYLAGGNVVSPAVYDARTGECLNGKIEEWQKGPRGRELFLVDGQVRVFDQLLYSPPDYQPSRYFSQGFFLQAGSEGTLVRAAQDRLVRLDAQKSTPTKPVALWQASDLADFAALAVTKNAVLATGKRTAGRISNPSEKPAAANKSDTQDTFVVAAYDLETGRTLWSGDLPAAPSSWGLAVDREGRAVVALRDGRVVCFQ